MRMPTLHAAVITALAMSALARAQGAPKSDPAQSYPIALPAPGEASKALATFFGGSLNWTGTLEPGAIGPDSKPAVTRGKANCRALYGGLWFACDVEEAMGTGKEARTRKGHLLVGYDLGTRGYRAMVIDNTGTMTTFGNFNIATLLAMHLERRPRIPH